MDEGHAAEVYFEPTYHNANIYFDPELMAERDVWVDCLVHELLHLYLSPMVNAALQYTGKMAEESLKNANETSTAHLEHIIVPLFKQVYAKELEKWLT